MDNIDNDNRYILSSVDSALEILNLFFEHEELGSSEIGQLIGVSRSTAFRFMITLEKRGFVTKTASGKYRLGLNMFSLGMTAYNRMELVSIVHPYLSQMASYSGETSHASILDDGINVLFVDRVLGTSYLKMDTAIGYRMKAHCTATGKAILAFSPDTTVSNYLSRAEFTQITPRSIKGPREFSELLNQIRSDGYACDNEEAEQGLTCYAVPLLDASGHAFAAISISGPTTRMESNKASHIKLLKSTANDIIRTIG